MATCGVCPLSTQCLFFWSQNHDLALENVPLLLNTCCMGFHQGARYALLATLSFLTSGRIGMWPKLGSSYCLWHLYLEQSEPRTRRNGWLHSQCLKKPGFGSCCLDSRVALILALFTTPLFWFLFELLQILSISSFPPILYVCLFFSQLKTLIEACLVLFLRLLCSLRTCAHIPLLQAHQIVATAVVDLEL